MSANGIDVFDKTLQTTHIWLDEIMEDIGPSRHVAWHVLGAVLRAIRDRIPIELAAHLGAQLPLLVRGTFYDQWRPHDVPEKSRTMEEFAESVADGLEGTRPIDPIDATHSVFQVLSRHISEGQVEKIQNALPEQVRKSWISVTRDVEGPDARRVSGAGNGQDSEISESAAGTARGRRQS